MTNNRSLEKGLQFRYKIMTTPALLLLFIFTIFPIFYNVYISFTNFSLMKSETNFIGFRNYVKFFSDRYTMIILGNTAKYVVSVVLAQFLLGFIAALMLSYIHKNRGWIAAILFMPWVVSQVFAVSAWRILFNDSYGIINYLLKVVGMQPVSWLADKNMALNVVILLNIWAGYGFSMTVLLGAIKGVPTELYEAAKVDGAGWLRQLLSITLPMIRYTILTNMIFISISTFNIFAYVFALTNGGPVKYSEVIGLTMYSTAFAKGAMGSGAAIAVVMLLFNALMALIYIGLFRRGDRNTI
ncbi:MAG: sugar ABC transporter permease [Clostridia bacterium]